MHSPRVLPDATGYPCSCRCPCPEPLAAVGLSGIGEGKRKPGCNSRIDGKECGMRGGPGRLGEGSRSLAKLALGSAPLDGSVRSRGEDGPGNIGVGLEGARWR